MSANDRKQYKAQARYRIDVLHAKLLLFLQNNTKLRGTNIERENGHLVFYFEGGKKEDTNCDISPKGYMIISFIKKWQRIGMEDAVKDAMEKAGYIVNDTTVKLLKIIPPYNASARRLLREGFLNYSHINMLLHLVPGLMERLKNGEIRWFTLVDYPYLILFKQVIEEMNCEGLEVRPAHDDVDRILQMQMIFEDSDDPKRSSVSVREEILRILKRKLDSAGLTIQRDDPHVDELVEDEFFDEEGACYSHDLSLEIHWEGQKMHAHASTFNIQMLSYASKIVNVVATATLNQKVNLNEIGRLIDIDYDSTKYWGRVAYFKTSSMRGKVSIFASGKMISIGTTSEKEAFSELEIAKNVLVEKSLAKPIALRPKIRNIVATLDLGKSVDLEKISPLCKMIYEPEQFPGGILRIEEPYNVTALVFASGKVVLAGLKGLNQIEPTVQELASIIEKAF